MSTSSTTIMVWIRTNELISKGKPKYLKSIYFWNVQAERNNLIYHSCKSTVVEYLTLLDLWMTFVNIFLTIHATHSKLCIFVILIRSRVVWYTWKVIWSLKFDPTWTLRDPYLEGAKSFKILSKYFLTHNDSKTINNSFSSKWHLSTSSTIAFNLSIINTKNKKTKQNKTKQNKQTNKNKQTKQNKTKTKTKQNNNKKQQQQQQKQNKKATTTTTKKGSCSRNTGKRSNDYHIPFEGAFDRNL